MGLDITVYEGHPLSVGCEDYADIASQGDMSRRFEKARDLGYRILRPADDFIWQFDGLLLGHPYTVERAWNFRAGSYSSYSAFRDALTKLVGYEPREYIDKCVTALDLGDSPPLPFWQLVYFSDCDGTIGPVACAGLAKDFRTWLCRAKAYAKTRPLIGEDFMELYRTWSNAVADGTRGWISFH